MPLEREFVYLGCPYSDNDPHVEEQRFIAVSKAAAYLMRQGHLVYSPISHCHPMKVHGGLPGGWQFWRRMDSAYMRHCTLLIVLLLDGWEKSEGVKSEITMAKELGIGVLFMDPRSNHIDWEEKLVKTRGGRVKSAV
mgnify:CR=1 FL=1